MLVHPELDPIAFHIGSFGIHWYGLMYLIGFALFYTLGLYRSRQAWRDITKENLEDLLFLGMIGVILGGRLGFVLFYQPEYYLRHPLQIFAVWQGGMSAHGGFIGVILAICYFAWRKKKSPLTVGDFVAPLVPLGFFFGRLGNFINGELWGRAADPNFPLAMIFPQAEDNIPRHPSQLYEATAEGLILFLIVWIYSTKARPRGAVSGLFFLVYGAGRFIVEFFREPDSYLGLQALSLSRGQWLCIPLIAAGIGLMAYAYLKKEKA
ncbi:prolipoprotein diacylglyceryl transferase [Turicimonas muris]|uniref:prolipoprotein diacylglyceryl transferase n=2 Tax=Turicimonas muris TaxID=1796652 RepID=UPI002674498C|nr:prolipoprotein diacylglyceryl transferase [Turicimonas muris]